MESIAELEARLAEAQRARREAVQRWQRGTPGANEACMRAGSTLLDAERALAAARGEEHALACDDFPKWDVGAPLPHVLASGEGVKLVYILSEPDPDWDGTYINVVSANDVSPVAIVEFKQCLGVKLGSPNDEVLHGHPLHGKGLGAYQAHTVVHSRWLAEVQQTNSVHDRYKAETYARLHHYLLAFHDETFECLAESAVIQTVRDSLSSVVRRLI